MLEGILTLPTDRMTGPKHIWLLAGYAGSGKDTVAGILQNLLGHSRAATSSFAGAVKDEVATMYELDRAYLDTQEGKARGMKLADGRFVSVRQLIIEHAETTKRTSGDPAIWAKRIQPPPAAEHWILSDWRFPEELQSLQQRFPESRIHTLRVHRPSVQPSTSYTEHLITSFPYEYIIDNSGSLLYIGTQLERVLKTVV